MSHLSCIAGKWDLEYVKRIQRQEVDEMIHSAYPSRFVRHVAVFSPDTGERVRHCAMSIVEGVPTALLGRDQHTPLSFDNSDGRPYRDRRFYPAKTEDVQYFN